MPVLTNAQIATLQKTLAVTNNVLPRLEMLEALAQINMGMKPRVAELRAQREYLAQLATAALEIERQLGTPVNIPTKQESAGISYTPPTGPLMPVSPPPAPISMYQPPLATSGVPQTYSPPPAAGVPRIFIRNAIVLEPAEEANWRQRGYDVEFEPGVGWWGVRRS